MWNWPMIFKLEIQVRKVKRKVAGKRIKNNCSFNYKKTSKHIRGLSIARIVG